MAAYLAASMLQGRGKIRPGKILTGKNSPGENLATLEIPNPNGKHHEVVTTPHKGTLSHHGT